MRNDRKLITVRVGNGTQLHAAFEGGIGLCGPAALAVMKYGSEVVKVADGTAKVDCDNCAHSHLGRALRAAK
jgi:hypothetical protein